MSSIQDIYEAIATEGFSEWGLQLIDEYVNDIQNGTRDFPRYNLSEHAGLCEASPVLIGASIIASYATRSFTASSHVEGCPGGPANWQMASANVFIDQVSGKPICIDCIVKFL